MEYDLKENGYLYKFPEVTSELVIQNTKKIAIPLDSFESVTGYICSMIQRRNLENFIAVAFDSRKNAICYEIISIGIESCANFSIRELLRFAILSNARYVVIYHNHVHGESIHEVYPSKTDDEATEYIYDRLNDFGITLADSIIVGYKRKIFSYRKSGRAPYDKDKTETKETIENE